MATGQVVRTQVPSSVATGPQRSTISTGVAKVQSTKSNREKHPKIKFGNTRDLGQQFFRFMLYGPTNARKTFTAARFGTEEEVRIILTRAKEQLRPLEANFSYEYAEVDNSGDLEALILHPESFWTDPTWTTNPNRTLIIDDITEGVNMLVDDNSIIDDREVKDARRSYREAGKSVRTWIQLAFRARQHIGVVALERMKEIPGGERITPDLPPSMQGMITTDLDYVFYIKTGLWKLIVDRKSETFEKLVDGKKDTLTRYIFAKNKQRYNPVKPMVGNGIFGPDEPMDLRKIWGKIVSANQARMATR